MGRGAAHEIFLACLRSGAGTGICITKLLHHEGLERSVHWIVSLSTASCVKRLGALPPAQPALPAPPAGGGAEGGRDC